MLAILSCCWFTTSSILSCSPWTFWTSCWSFLICRCVYSPINVPNMPWASEKNRLGLPYLGNPLRTSLPPKVESPRLSIPLAKRSARAGIDLWARLKDSKRAGFPSGSWGSTPRRLSNLACKLLAIFWKERIKLKYWSLPEFCLSAGEITLSGEIAWLKVF